MTKKETIIVQNLSISIIFANGQDYISLNDIARNKNAEAPKDVVKNWTRSRSTIEFLGLWEQLNNTHFKGVEFDSFLAEAGSMADYSKKGMGVLINFPKRESIIVE